MLAAGELELGIREASAAGNRPPAGQDRERSLSLVMRADEAAGESDSTVMVQAMLDLMLEASQAESANFFELDHARDEFVVTHVRGEAECSCLVGLRFHREQVLPGISLFPNSVLVAGELPSAPDWLKAVNPERALQKLNVLNIPVANQDRTLGVVQLFNYRYPEMDLLQILARRLAVELEHRRVASATQQSYQRLLALVDVLGEAAGTLDRNRLLHLVTEQASRLVDAERSSIFLVDPDTKEMLFQVAYLSPEEAAASSASSRASKSGLLQRLQSSRQAASSPGSDLQSRQSGEFSYFNRGVITVPLQSGISINDPELERRQAIGGLMVINKQNASFQKEDAQLMRILAGQAGTYLQIAEMVESAGDLFLDVIRALVSTIDAKDPYTQGHSQRVSDLAVVLAREFGLDESRISDIRIGALFHDIGKIGIPDLILTKNGRLSDQERDVIKQHPRQGAIILSQVKLLEPLTPAIIEHHERLDGSGYPHQLSGKQISWMGRIVAVADVFDAMTSNRPYRLALSDLEALSYLQEQAGIQFDAQCVEALEAVLARKEAVKGAEQDL